MASALYPIGKKALLDAGINLDTDTIKAALLDTGTVAYNTAHDFYNDVSAGVIGTPQTIANTTTTSGTFDGDNVTYTAVTGATVEAIVIYKDTGNAATSNLIAFIDTGTGLPVTPNGGDITVSFHASGIFSIG